MLDVALKPPHDIRRELATRAHARRLSLTMEFCCVLRTRRFAVDHSTKILRAF